LVSERTRASRSDVKSDLIKCQKRPTIVSKSVFFSRSCCAAKILAAQST
jgi:hypothetical protein